MDGMAHPLKPDLLKAFSQQFICNKVIIMKFVYTYRYLLTSPVKFSKQAWDVLHSFKKFKKVQESWSQDLGCKKFLWASAVHKCI